MKKPSNKALLASGLSSKCSFTLSKLRFLGLRPASTDAAGRIVAELKREGADVELVAVEPFAEFRAMFSGDDIALYDEVLRAADERVVVAENDKMAYMRRNDYLVDNAAVVVAWWDGKPRSGTAYTVKRARKKRLEVVNLYPQPQLELEF